jgi:hypothetical protein
VLADILEDSLWQMSPGERAAIKGILAELEPAVAIELGIGQGGSLRRIAAAAGHVHAFDVSAPAADLGALPNVTFHTGDSHQLLPRVLTELAEDGANVDFVLVDGDHSAEGVRRDVEDLLASPALSRTLIVLHDTANAEVRAGLNSIEYAAWPQLTWVDLDWIPGFRFREGPIRGEAWGGLGIMVADAEHGPAAGPAIVASYAYPAAAVLAAYSSDARKGASNGRDAQALRGRIAELERLQAQLTCSVSWRLTHPLRTLKRALRR